MQEIPLQPVPNQNFTIVLEQIICKINLYLLGTHLYFDMDANNTVLTRSTICENANKLIKQPYYGVDVGFFGNFLFIDTVGQNDPEYLGLGTRYKLIYLTGDEVAQLL